MTKNTTDKSSSSAYIGIGLTIGISLGAAFGVVFGNIAMGVSLGVVAGIVFGSVLCNCAGVSCDTKDAEEATESTDTE